MDRPRPRVSRETRLLLGIVFVALASLWVLARLRFPDRPRNPNPVPPVLAQFAPPSPFEAIAAAVSGVEARSGPTLVRVTFTPRVWDPATGDIVRLAVRVNQEYAIVVAPSSDASGATPQVIGIEARTRLAAVRVPPAAPAAPATWSVARPPTPRFLIAAEATRDSVSYVPVFVGAFVPLSGPEWPRPVWRLPRSAPVADGALLFTDDGLLAGVVVTRGDDRVLVPPEALMDVPRAVVAHGAIRERGVPGVTVQEATPLVASAMGVEFGLVVAWVDPEGPAAGLLQPLDVIDGVDGQPIASREQWDARLDRLEVGASLALQVRRANAAPTTVTLVAAQAPAPRSRAPLGAAFRLRRGAGVEIIRVEPGEAAEHAGLRVGDLVTAAGGILAPTPAQVLRLYADEGDRPVGLAVTRGAMHFVLALERTW